MVDKAKLTFAESIAEDLFHLSDETVTPLNRLVHMKRISNAMKALNEQLMARANAEYLKIKIGPAEEWPICNGLAIVSDATPKVSWAYPQVIEEALEALKVKMTVCQANGEAKKTSTFNPKKNQMFKIWLKPDEKKK